MALLTLDEYATKVLAKRGSPPPSFDRDREAARAMADAGYMTVAEYLLCRENGWKAHG